jgi:hypothetical protein
VRAALAASPRVLLALRVGSASVWFGFGFYAKLLAAVPRHERIVARVVGDALSGPLVTLVGFAEVSLAVWILSSRFPKSCAAAQTLALIGMNTLELCFARDLLLFPGAMVVANLGLLSVAWVLGLVGSRTKGGH